ncbi:PE-PGRS family protein, partial [Mycobacterium tuberculosis]
GGNGAHGFNAVLVSDGGNGGDGGAGGRGGDCGAGG